MDLELALASAGSTITPVAVRDDAAMARNLASMAALARVAGVRLRPHCKTHKSSAVAARQLAAGAAGLTVATLQEAEVFSEADCKDILIAHPPVGAEKHRRLAALLERGVRLSVSIDDLELARAVPAAAGIYWEVDTGLGRMGTQPGQPTVAAVRRLVELVGPHRFRGLMTHGGHGYRTRDLSELRVAAREESNGVAETASMLRSLGVEVSEVSVGSTPTAGFAGEQAGITEMRPGTYVYGDAGQVTLGAHRIEDCALAVVTTVISSPERGRAVLDCGSKSLSADRLVARLEGFGIVLEHPHLRVERLSEEHAVVTAREGLATGLVIGQRLAVIPSHVCTTVNLHPALLCFDADRRRTYWEAVDARGWRPYDAAHEC